MYIIKAMPPAKASTYTYVNPVVAILLGWLILHESVTMRDIAGALVILTGVVMVQTSRFRQAALGKEKEGSPERTTPSPAESDNAAG